MSAAHVEPIRWRAGALELLDQRLLPAREHWLRCEELEQVAVAIETLAVRGAPAIGIAAAYGLALAAAREDSPEAFEAAVARLAATRPTAVDLEHALACGRERRASGGSLLELAHERHAAQRAADERMAELGAALCSPGDRVLTHCNAGALATGGAGTALGVIVRAHADGRLAHVWAGETRPLLQGARLTAFELARAGVPFALVTDSSVGLLMARGLVDRVIVGADRVAANGDVANKIGTYTVAVVAARHGVPLTVVAPLSTIDPATPSGAQIPIEERAPAEVTHLHGELLAPPEADARNWAFDVTPAELVAELVCEAGVLRAPLPAAIAAVTRAAAPRSPVA